MNYFQIGIYLLVVFLLILLGIRFLGGRGTLASGKEGLEVAEEASTPPPQQQQQQDPPSQPPDRFSRGGLITEEWKEAFGRFGGKKNNSKDKNKDGDLRAKVDELQKMVAALETKTAAIKYYPAEELTTFSGKVTFETPINGTGKTFQVPFVHRGGMYIQGTNESDEDVRVNYRMLDGPRAVPEIQDEGTM